MKHICLSSHNNSFSLSAREGEAALKYKENETSAEIEITLNYSAVFGMGEKFNSLNQKGNHVVNTVEEKFCHQGEKTYISAPFFFTDTGFGLYVKTSEVTEFDFKDKITVTLPKNTEIITFCGTPKEIISEYMSLFGKIKLPPKWAFGPFISANRWNSQKLAENAAWELLKYNFPATVLVLEAWSDEATFYIFNGAKYIPKSGENCFEYSDFDFGESVWNSPKEMIENLHRKGLHLILWQAPVYKKQEDCETPNKQNDLDRQYAKEHNLCVMKKNGEVYTIPKGNWFAGSMIPDFTNEDTKKLWFKKRRYLLDIGVDGFKTDGGEFIYEDDLTFNSGETGKEMKNRYAQSYAESYGEFAGDKRIIFSRAGFSGRNTAPIHWAGDQQSENCEFKSVLNAGLSASMSGIPFWGFDTAGFAGKLPTLDLYRRATQTACFSPIMQWHSEPDGGQFKDILKSEKGNNERSPWNLAKVNNTPEFIDEMRFWYNLRMNLIPYIYSSAEDCTENGLPLMRPLAYDFNSDKNAAAIEDEYMFGESLLVCPMLRENAKGRKVFLPRGEWYGFFNKKIYHGGKSYDISCEKSLPVFIRGGFAVALNLDGTVKLGAPVGNSVESYKNLTIFAAGKEGSYKFKDNLKNSFVLKWKNNEYKIVGEQNTPMNVLILN